LENVTLTLADEKFTLGVVENLSFKNVIVNGKPYVLPPMVAPAVMKASDHAAEPPVEHHE
jgi:hypothetical protein